MLYAWAMNGHPLPRVHGAPVRVVVPGHIGARSVKWVQTITAQTQPSDNYFQATAYRLVDSFHLTAPVLIWSVLLGPLAGVVSALFTQLTTAARTHTPRGWRLPVTTTVLFAAVGALAIPFPQLLGNGKGPAQLAFNGALGLPLFAALALLKPLATALCLRSGATGGLLTPALATGALLGAATGGLWTHIWPGTPLGAYALIGATAVLATTQRAPLTAIVLVLEFTHTGLALLVPILIAVGAATLTHQHLHWPAANTLPTDS